MALKGDRVELETDITQTCQSVAERGVVLCYRTNGSGVALGGTAGQSDLYVNPSGLRVSGLLMNDVVSLDTTRFHINYHKDETLVGNSVKLLRKGRATTNRLVGTPNVGDIAYLTASGNVTPTVSATGGLIATPKVGVFAGRRDENGFVAIDVNLPVV